MNKVFLWFVKITGWPVQLFYYHKKVYLYNNDKRLRKIKGGALIVSNHTSLYDYPLIMYTFMKRTIRTLVAEVMYKKNYFLTKLVSRMGAIRVDRDTYDFSFMPKMINVLNKGQVGLVFPESRLPLDNEKGQLLEFKPSYIYLALESEVPIIPVYTNGVYGKAKRKLKDRARIVIGNPIYVHDLYRDDLDEKENIKYINDYVKGTILELEKYLERTH